MANLDAARALTEGRTEADVQETKDVAAKAALDKARADAVRQVDLRNAQQQYVSTIRDVMTQKMGIDEAIKKVTQTTAETFPDDPKAIANHIIATVNGALRLPFYANQPDQVKRLNKILSDQYAVLAGESGKEPRAHLATKDQSIWDGLFPGVDVNQATPEQLGRFKQAKADADARQHTMEDAKLKQVLAQGRHLNSLSTRGPAGGGRHAAPKNPIDDALMQISRAVNIKFHGAFDTDSKELQAYSEQKADEIVSGNPALAAQKRPGETSMSFLYRMLLAGQNVPSSAQPAPTPTAGGPTSQATPPAPPSTLGGGLDQIAP